MDQETLQLLTDGSAVTGITAVVEFVKRTVPKAWVKYMPLFAVGFGQAYAHLLRPGDSIGANAMIGMLLAMAAVGGYSGVKNFLQKRKK